MSRLSKAQIALGLGAVVVIAAGFFAGRALKADPTPGYAFDTSSDVFEATGPEPGLTKGGFSGFGETAGLPGFTLLSGKVAAISSQELVLEAADGTQTKLRLANPGGVRRIEASSRDALRTGASVVVRHTEGSNEVEAVLILEVP